MTNEASVSTPSKARPSLVLFTGHQAEITALAFSPDGKTIATGSNDRTVILWDSHTGEIRAKLLGHKHNLWALSFSPDGMALASADWEETRLWDLAANETRQVLPDLTHMLQFSPDGRLIAAIRDGDIVLWSLAGNYLEHVLGESPSSWRTPSVFSPSGAMLGVAGWREVQLWDVSTGKLLRVLTIPHHLGGENANDEIHSVTFSADSALLAADCGSRVLVWDAIDGSVVATMEHPNVAFAAFTAEGSFIVSSNGQNAIFWDTRSWKRERELAFDLCSDQCLVIYPGGRILASSPDGGILAGSSWATKASVLLRSLHTGKLLTVLRGVDRSVNDIAYTPDGRALISGDSDGTIRVWSVGTGSLSQTISAFDMPVTQIAVAPDGRTIAAASRSIPPDQPGELAVWDLQSGNRKYKLPGCAYFSTSLAFSPDGQLLAAEEAAGGVGLWNVETGDRVRHLAGCGPVAFSPDGKLLATGDEVGYWHSSSRKTDVWDIETGELIHSLVALHRGEYAESVTSLAFSPDGTLLAIGHDCFVVTLWDVRSGSLLEELVWRTYAEGVTALAFAKDGKSIAVGLPYEDDIHLWSTSGSFATI